MKAFILNSGMGRRMEMAGRPKCMTPLGDDDTIVSRQLRALQTCGIQKIVMTVGPFAGMLRRHASKYAPKIQYVLNPWYEKTNYIYSMYLSRFFLEEEDILLLHGDLVLEVSVLEDLIQSKDSAVIVEDGIPLPKKDFKARIANGRITRIGVDVFGEDCAASQPAYKLRRMDMRAWMDVIETFCQRQATGVYAEEALNTVLEDRVLLRPVPLRGRLCHEIDDRNDLAEVRGRLEEIGGRL